jgi:histidyl-tRNA synthetase
MLIPLDQESLEQVNNIAIELRAEGRNVAIDYDIPRKYEKRIKAAQKLQIPQVATIENGELKIREI